MDRRDFLKVGCGSLASLSIGKTGLFSVAKADDRPLAITDPNPIQLIPWAQLSSQDFNGDDIDRTHEALWNKDGYLAKRGGIPSPSEYFDTVVVGGGISGLLTGHFLKHRQPVLLEQGVNFGGNSRGEYLPDQTFFSIGAAYITKPDEGSLTHQVLANLGLLSRARTESSLESTVLYQKRLYQGFWKGQTDPQAQQQFQRIFQRLQLIFEKQYPDVPWLPQSQVSWPEFVALDQLSFVEWLTQTFGLIHPHVLEYFQLYCWSSFGGSMEELSAAQALNFLAAETTEVLAFPGGNSMIAQALYNDLYYSVGPSFLRAGHLVLDVRLDAGGVNVCYETPSREIKTLKARNCVVAAPKFVAKRIVSDMSLQQQRACELIGYRAYLVANVFVDIRRRPMGPGRFSPCFDLYSLEGQVPPIPSALRPSDRLFTDICFGSWAQGDLGNIGVLTVYKPFPYEGARQFLFSPFSHNKHMTSIRNGIGQMLTNLNVQESDILGVRMTRWGHSLPLARIGALSSGQLEVASASIGDRIFFANQDNWVNPSFEVALQEAAKVASRLG